MDLGRRVEGERGGKRLEETRNRKEQHSNKEIRHEWKQQLKRPFLFFSARVQVVPANHFQVIIHVKCSNDPRSKVQKINILKKRDSFYFCTLHSPHYIKKLKDRLPN